MPQGKATWPAYWTCGDNWPLQGEFDIIEGVDDSASNLVSLHTGPNCQMPKSGLDMSGSATAWDCDASSKHSQGCSVRNTASQPFGPDFNSQGGGWYATERTDSSFKVWYWARNDPNVPKDVRDNTGSASPSEWGQPTAAFMSSDSCDLSKQFGPHIFIINLTLCGDWAGGKFDGGKDACNSFVSDHPEAFKDAYWDINRLSVYEH
ncbi:hypothetical protein EXIGLDRAFT_837555 [Exidia glandulosa HHB12029]|nr:hypothetical protein EXIGLDRAFT_837555 [Exidia glandulosa HHB12029]